jgi:serine/threonine protein kinase
MRGSGQRVISTKEEVRQIKARMVAHPLRNDTPRYAVKHLRAVLKKDSKYDAIIDLACEAEILSRIMHPNIVRLRATVGMPGSPLFMLIMDRLTQTLEQKIQEWSQEYKKVKGGLIRRKDKLGLTGLSKERLLAAYDIARALRHLHSKSLVFRDLKPVNIGVDPRGDFRLFDFGLVKELKPRDLVEKPDGYKATGVTGSRRYMAPEVALCRPYGFSADVYSFGILFWEIFTLQKPFPNYDTAKLLDKVVVAGKRPPFDTLLIARGPCNDGQYLVCRYGQTPIL